MASYTPNLNLKKPAGSESVVIGDINGNMDTIDSAYGSMSSLIAEKPSKVDCGSVNSSTPLSISMSNGERSIIVGIGSHERRTFMVTAYVSGSGSVSLVEINKGNYISIATSTNTVTITSTDSSDSYVRKILL